MNTLVSIRDLHKVYFRGNERIDVLQGVTLDIPEGDFLALMGPSVPARRRSEPDGRPHADGGVDPGRRRSHRQACREASSRRGVPATSASSSRCTTCCRC